MLIHNINSVHSISETHLRIMSVVQGRKERMRTLAPQPAVRHHQVKLVLLHSMWRKRRRKGAWEGRGRYN
jgi:hypothetical protein